MTISLTSPVSGSAQTGFTAPTYTVVQDTAPAWNGKQYAVTAVGGTQTGVDINSVSKPFTTTFFKPQVLKSLPQPSPAGVYRSVPINQYKLLTRKGGSPAANQAAIPFKVETVIQVPAGVDTYEPEEVRAALSLHIGCLTQMSAGIGDTVVTGVM